MGALQTLQVESVSTRPLHADDDQSIAGYGGKLGAEQTRAQPTRPTGNTEEPWGPGAAAAARHNNWHREVAQRGVGGRRVCWEPQTWRGPSWQSGSLAVQQSNHSGGSHQACNRRVVGPVESAC